MYTRDESLISQLVAVWVTELDFSKGSASAWIVDDLLYDASYVAMSLGLSNNEFFIFQTTSLCAHT